MVLDPETQSPQPLQLELAIEHTFLCFLYLLYLLYSSKGSVKVPFKKGLRSWRQAQATYFFFRLIPFLLSKIEFEHVLTRRLTSQKKYKEQTLSLLQSINKEPSAMRTFSLPEAGQ